jgi:hypothetical protein
VKRACVKHKASAETFDGLEEAGHPLCQGMSARMRDDEELYVSIDAQHSLPLDLRRHLSQLVIREVRTTEDHSTEAISMCSGGQLLPRGRQYPARYGYLFQVFSASTCGSEIGGFGRDAHRMEHRNPPG